MSAFVIGHISVKDPERWAEYRSKVPATLLPWGAELVLRGSRTALLCGEHKHTDTVVIRFPDTDAVTRWYDSAAYQALLPLRALAAEVDLVSYEFDT